MPSSAVASARPFQRLLSGKIKSRRKNAEGVRQLVLRGPVTLNGREKFPKLRQICHTDPCGSRQRIDAILLGSNSSGEESDAGSHRRRRSGFGASRCAEAFQGELYLRPYTQPWPSLRSARAISLRSDAPRSAPARWRRHRGAFQNPRCATGHPHSHTDGARRSQ